MLQNAYFLAKIGADTAENEQHFAEILPTDALPQLQTSAARLAELCRAGAAFQDRDAAKRGAVRRVSSALALATTGD